MQKPPTLALAPMQDVTNLPLMRVMQQYGGPDYYVTEYFRVHADYTLEKKILSSITENETGRPENSRMGLNWGLSFNVTPKSNLYIAECGTT